MKINILKICGQYSCVTMKESDTNLRDLRVQTQNSSVLPE
jgi:hypothetical protein